VDGRFRSLFWVEMRTVTKSQRVCVGSEIRRCHHHRGTNKDNAARRDFRDGRDGERGLMLSQKEHHANLTRDERAVLAASARGLVSDDVATTLGKPPETVRQLISSARQKLGARSKLEAVLLALRYGLINVEV
jgi:DNA-binding NarL/FixJ family response regulator